MSIDIDLTVNELIDIRTRGWKLSKLNELFYPIDVARISTMKPMVLKDDLWTWKCNKNGDYSIKS